MVKYSTSTFQSGVLDTIFYALSDPIRRAILERLSEGTAKVTELAKPFTVSLPAISKHLKVLEEARLIKRTKNGRVIQCRFNPAALKTAYDWLEEHRQFWEGNFDALEDYLSKSVRKK